MTTTPNAIIVRALRKSGVNGVGQTPSTDDLNDALADFNDMLAQWARRRWLISHETEVVFGPTGQTSYTVGTAPGSDINITRPDRIESAFVRYNPNGASPADIPLDVLDSWEDYGRITLKNYQSAPASLFYDAAFPVAKLYLWPVQQGNGSTEVHLLVKGGDLSTPWALNDPINLPPEYTEALLYNLAVRMRASYQLGPDSVITALAISSLQTIRNANAQIGRSLMPAGLPGMRGRREMTGFYGGGTGAQSSAIFTLDVTPLDSPAVLA